MGSWVYIEGRQSRDTPSRDTPITGYKSRQYRILGIARIISCKFTSLIGGATNKFLRLAVQTALYKYFSRENVPALSFRSSFPLLALYLDTLSQRFGYDDHDGVGVVLRYTTFAKTFFASIFLFTNRRNFPFIRYTLQDWPALVVAFAQLYL